MIISVVTLSITIFALLSIIIYQQNIINGQKLAVKEFVGKSTDQIKEVLVKPITAIPLDLTKNDDSVEFITIEHEISEENKRLIR